MLSQTIEVIMNHQEPKRLDRKEVPLANLENNSPLDSIRRKHTWVLTAMTSGAWRERKKTHIEHSLNDRSFYRYSIFLI